MSILDALKKALSSDKKQSPTLESPSTPSPDQTYSLALEAQRAEKDYYFRRDPYSPIDDRVNFNGLVYYPPDPALRLTLPLQRVEPEALTFQTSTGDERIYLKMGVVEFEVEGQPVHLAIYQAEEHDELFLPFRDATSGQETYGAGRYLEPELLANGQILLDFNLAYNPYCAYSEAYSCPLPPLENWLTTVAIRAGEKI